MAFGLLKRIGRGLTRTTQSIFGKVGGIFSDNKLSAESLGELEKMLLGADFGRSTVAHIVEEVEKAQQEDRSLRSLEVTAIAERVIREELSYAEKELLMENPPQVILLLGINGSGKTTTAAKLAAYFSARGARVLLGACDTFRAAANEQIQSWAEKLNLDLVHSCHGADATAVAYDALSAAIARKKDLLILDTAGRLHTKEGLLGELGKMQRVLSKRFPYVGYHRWLVVDGSLGTNSLEQARQFNGTVPLSGIVVTKLDGSSRGGALVAIHREMGLPIYFVGTGETAESLQPFSVDGYMEALFGPR